MPVIIAVLGAALVFVGFAAFLHMLLWVVIGAMCVWGLAAMAGK